MNLEGISASSEEFLVTSGSQMGLDLISKLFINPGDVVLTTSPTYPGAINTFQGMEAKVIQLRSDEQGICPVALREEIERCLGPSIARRLVQYFSAPRADVPPDAFPELTGREHEILELIARHETNPEIAISV